MKIIFLSLCCVSFALLNAQTQSLNDIPLSVDISSEVVTNAAKSPKKSTVDSTLIKLKDIEKMIQGLKNELKKEIIESIRDLPTIVNNALQQTLNEKTTEIAKLTRQLDTARLDIDQATKESKDFQSRLKIVRDSVYNINSALKKEESANDNMWDSFIKEYLKSSAKVADVQIIALKKQAPMYSKDLDSLLANSKIITDMENYLYAGIGKFDDIYAKFKIPMNKTKFPEQAKNQLAMQSVISLFIKYSNELRNKLTEISQLSNELRKSELEEWRQNKYVSYFPALKAIIESNYKGNPLYPITTTAP
jgi:hypothetical protein